MTMTRFVEGCDRKQGFLLPASVEDYVTEDNPVRVIDVFVDSLDLAELGFDGINPLATGRPSYHPATMLKIYIYGYINRIQSSRRLERETQRNIELMWLAGQLTPDFKTIADFRKDNGKAIRGVCSQFVGVCRKLNLFSQAIVAIDGSKFKAVNNRDKNFTTGKVKRRMEQIEESVARYLNALETADRQEPAVAEARTARLKEKLAILEEEMKRFKGLKAQLAETPDQQISLTDPDARSMATSGKGSGIVGYNVQSAVDAEHHLIVAHEVTNSGKDAAHLSNMANLARDAIGTEKLTAVADRGYFEGEEIKACEEAGITTFVPKPLTSGAKADGRFGKQDFIYLAEDNEYRCPAGERLIWRFTTEEGGKNLHVYWSSACQTCAIKAQCMPPKSKERRVKRWEHEAVLDTMQRRLDLDPGKMRIRRSTVEHPFGTIKAWMGATHFLTRTLDRVSTEMSLHVLAYNIKRVMTLLGTAALIEAVRA